MFSSYQRENKSNIDLKSYFFRRCVSTLHLENLSIVKSDIIYFSDLFALQSYKNVLLNV